MTRAIPSLWKGLAAAWLLCLTVLLLSACDSASLDPFQQSNQHFSIFGYLNVSEDTQYVRVSAMRDSIGTARVPLDAVVRLENLGTGEQTVWRDSLFRFDDGRYAHNFWAPMRLDPGATYRLTVTRSDGAASTVTVTMPDRVSHPFLDTGTSIGILNPSVQAIAVEGVDRLADVQVRYLVPGRDPGQATERVTFSYVDEVRRYTNGRLAFNANLYQDLRDRTGGGCPSVLDAEIYLVAAGPDWPDFLSLDPETLALPDVVSNVEQGVGFVGGIATRVVPWVFLTNLFQSKQAWCDRGCLSAPRGC